MKYTEPSFSVNPSSAKAPKDCRHGWIDARGRCVLCGESNPVKTLRGQIVRRPVEASADEYDVAAARAFFLRRDELAEKHFGGGKR